MTQSRSKSVVENSFAITLITQSVTASDGVGDCSALSATVLRSERPPLLWVNPSLSLYCSPIPIARRTIGSSFSRAAAWATVRGARGTLP